MLCSTLTNAREAAKARRTEAVMVETLLQILLESCHHTNSTVCTKSHPGCCQGGALDVTTSTGRSRSVDRQHTSTRPWRGMPPTVPGLEKSVIHIFQTIYCQVKILLFSLSVKSFAGRLTYYCQRVWRFGKISARSSRAQWHTFVASFVVI